MNKNNYYDAKYFKWQKGSGQLGPILDDWKFKKEINKDDCVLDFGCGGGYILKSIECKYRYGVEINETARGQSVVNGIKVFPDINSLPDGVKFDKIISNHAIEHVVSPFETLTLLKNKLKDDGVIIFFIPIDDWRREKKFLPSDINKHLYTWTPLLIGNLFSFAGFKINKISVTSHTWFPLSRVLCKFFPKKIIYFLCCFWGAVIMSRQIKVVASK